MGLFDSLKGMAEGALEGEAHQALAGALDSSSLGGVSGVMDKLQAGGLGDLVSSWTQGGEQLPVSEDQLRSVLGDEHIQHFADSLGIPTDQVLQTLSQHLPQLAAAQSDS
jgi:uncharacterized protein YidB (DUF937 family)